MTHSSDRTEPKDWKPHPMARLFSWSEKPGSARWVLIGLLAVCALLVVLDALTHGHAHFAVENILGSYGIYGFASFCFVVLMGWPLRALIGRAPDYYEPEDEPTAPEGGAEHD